MHYKLRTETEEIVVFLFGDYAFLSYGISGATGTFRACSVLIQTESKEPTKKRALQSLHTDAQQFLESGGKTNAVKCFNNKLRHPFLEIKIANIDPPYLYILLGITLKHPNLIQKEVQNRDEIIAK